MSCVELSDSSDIDEDEGSKADALVEPTHTLLGEDEWHLVVKHLICSHPRHLAAFAVTSLRMHLVLNAAILSCPAACISTRQDAVEALARALRRGLAAGCEAAVAVTVAAQVAVDVDDKVRRVAARSIFYVFRISEDAGQSSASKRPGGGLAARESVRSGVRIALSACVGDAHAVALRVADEQDSDVRRHMSSWYEE